MPRVYLFDKRNGVTLMHKYVHPPYSKKFDEECTQVALLAKAALGRSKDDDFEYADVHIGNCGKDEHNNLVLFDLGCFGTLRDGIYRDRSWTERRGRRH